MHEAALREYAAAGPPRKRNPKWILLFIPLSIAALVGIYLACREVIEVHTRSNAVTLIVELSIGIFVSFVLFWAAKKNEWELQSKVDVMRDNLAMIVDGRARRQAQAYAQLTRSLHEAAPIIGQIMDEYKRHDGSAPGGTRDHHRAEILDLRARLADLSGGGLDRILVADGEHLHDATYDTVSEISSWCKSRPNFASRNRVAGPGFYEKLRGDILAAAENLMGVFPEYPEGHAFMVSCDKSVYSAGSRIHVLANMPLAEPGAPIRFEIFDSKGRLMDVKIVNAGSTPLPDPSGLHGAIFRMGGDRWRTREEYTVRATYGTRHVEDEFTIDKRTPVIQTDKEVYMEGGDMIITVIDPDSDRDSEVAEHVGDRPDSKLVIETNHGRIEGYRLVETGSSTGIFQGVVGILGVRDDGTVVPYDTADGPVKGTQGTGIDDGYIEASPGGRITLTYWYGSRPVQLVCKVAGPTTDLGGE
ncbi:MAG: hypothetical protein MPL62_08445 [Alphaproteobacteria bacterium]|nr:hypothetical protein [Alphaproteobacteria bacterium]